METGEFELEHTANTFSTTGNTDNITVGYNATYEPFNPFRGEIEILYPFIFSVFGMGFVAVWSRRYHNQWTPFNGVIFKLSTEIFLYYLL